MREKKCFAVGWHYLIIKVGKDGKVPFKAIVRRFHEVGSRRDADSTDSVVLPRELTPSQIREWWDDPSVCDIEGVDTEDSDIYSVPISIRGKKRAALSKIAVLADRKESARIKKVLADSFTADELELMASGIPLMVSSEEHLRDCTGFYLRRQEGCSVPQIVLENGTTPDGIVHEAVHHLRAVDGRTSFPTKDGILDKPVSGWPWEKWKVSSAASGGTSPAATVRPSRPPHTSASYTSTLFRSPQAAAPSSSTGSTHSSKNASRASGVMRLYFPKNAI